MLKKEIGFFNCNVPMLYIAPNSECCISKNDADALNTERESKIEQTVDMIRSSYEADKRKTSLKPQDDAEQKQKAAAQTIEITSHSDIILQEYHKKMVTNRSSLSRINKTKTTDDENLNGRCHISFPLEKDLANKINTELESNVTIMETLDKYDIQEETYDWIDEFITDSLNKNKVELSPLELHTLSTKENEDFNPNDFDANEIERRTKPLSSHKLRTILEGDTIGTTKETSKITDDIHKIDSNEETNNTEEDEIIFYSNFMNHETLTKSLLIKAQKQDEFCQTIINYRKPKTGLKMLTQKMTYRILRGILCHIHWDSELQRHTIRPILPEKLGPYVCTLIHRKNCHLSADLTRKELTNIFFLRKARKVTQEAIAKCLLCKFYNPSKFPRAPIGLKRSYCPKQPREAIAIDLAIALPPNRRKYSNLLVIVDLFSSYVMAAPLRTKKPG